MHWSPESYLRSPPADHQTGHDGASHFQHCSTQRNTGRAMCCSNAVTQACWQVRQHMQHSNTVHDAGKTHDAPGQTHKRLSAVMPRKLMGLKQHHHPPACCDGCTGSTMLTTHTQTHRPNHGSSMLLQVHCNQGQRQRHRHLTKPEVTATPPQVTGNKPYSTCSLQTDSQQ